MYFYSLFCCQVFCNLFTHRYVRIAFAAPVDMQVNQSVVNRNPVGIVANRFPSGRKLKPIARIGRVAVYHRVIFDIGRCVFADIRSKVADHGSGAYGSIASDGDNLLQASEMDFDLTLGKPVGDFYLLERGISPSDGATISRPVVRDLTVLLSGKGVLQSVTIVNAVYSVAPFCGA